MAGANGEVVIIVAGEDQSGQVMAAVEANLARVQARSASAGTAMVAAGEHAVPAMAAASASVRVLDGNFNNLMRAEERFLSSLPGVAAAMQVAFPVIGLFAVVEGLARASMEITDFIRKNEQMGTTITREFGDARLAVEKNNDALRVSNDRLEMELAKLAGKPGNGLKLALDEARVSADELATSLIADNNRVAELMKKNSVGGWASYFTNQRNTSEAEDFFSNYQGKSRDIAYDGQQREHSAKNQQEADAIRKDTQARLKALQDETVSAADKRLAELRADENNFDIYGKETHYNDAVVADYKGIRSDITDQQDTITLRSRQEELEKTKEIGEERKQQNELAKQAAREREQEQKREQEWLTKVQKMGIGPSAQAGYERDKNTQKLLEEAHKQQQEMADQQAESYIKGEEAKAEAAVKASKKEIEADRQAQEGRIRGAGDSYKGTSQDTEYAVKMGTMKDSERAQAMRRAAQEEFQVKLNAMEQIRALDAIDPDNPEKVQRDLDQIAELRAAYARQMTTIDQQEAEKRRTTQEGVLKDLIDPLMEGTKKLSDRFKEMADNIISQLERIAEKKAIDGILGMLNGGGGSGQGSGAGGAKGGMGGVLGGILGSLLHGGSQKASNGGLATGAGTIADATASGLQQGRGGAGGAGVSVNIINQGTPQAVASSGSSGGGMEQMVISLVLKDADTLGPMTQGLRGAMSMLG